MTLEERFAKQEEQVLVQAERVARFERETPQRLVIHEEQLESHALELAEFRATVARGLELLERFVSGQGGGNRRGNKS